MALGIVTDNKWLDLYVELINKNKTQKKLKYITQKHHIIPRAYFNHEHLRLDNTADNIVNLKYSDHIIAHYYLALCAISWFLYPAQHGFLYLISRLDMIKSTQNTSELILESNLDSNNFKQLEFYDTIYQLDKELEANRLKNGTWMNNGTNQQYVTRGKFNEFLANHWVQGKLPITEAQSKTLSESRKGRKGKPHTEQWKKDMSIKLTGRKQSEDTKLKVSTTKKEQYEAGLIKPWNKGLNKETDERVAKNLRGFEKTQFKKGNKPWNDGLAGTYKFVYNEIQTKKVLLEEVDTYLQNGWKLGKPQRNK